MKKTVVKSGSVPVDLHGRRTDLPVVQIEFSNRKVLSVFDGETPKEISVKLREIAGR
jgi:hypothetical protein